MKRYCQKCGSELAEEDKFCHKCGQKAAEQPQEAPPVQNPRQSAAKPAVSAAPSPNENPVRYVKMNLETGQIAQNPNQKTRSESMMQGLTIAFVAIAVVLVMVAGSMFIAGHMPQNATFEDDTTTESQAIVSSEVSSEEEIVSSEPESVEEVSSAVPPELQASYLKSKLKGKWSTKLPYKNMSLPVTFTFYENGRCSCAVKALFITKQFDGNYSIEDGGNCTITLNGLEEYMSEGNTLTGKMEFISDDKINFTAGNDIWILDRVE